MVYNNNILVVFLLIFSYKFYSTNLDLEFLLNYEESKCSYCKCYEFDYSSWSLSGKNSTKSYKNSCSNINEITIVYSNNKSCFCDICIQNKCYLKEDIVYYIFYSFKTNIILMIVSLFINFILLFLLYKFFFKIKFKYMNIDKNKLKKIINSLTNHKKIHIKFKNRIIFQCVITKNLPVQIFNSIVLLNDNLEKVKNIAYNNLKHFLLLILISSMTIGIFCIFIFTFKENPFIFIFFFWIFYLLIFIFYFYIFIIYTKINIYSKHVKRIIHLFEINFNCKLIVCRSSKVIIFLFNYYKEIVELNNKKNVMLNIEKEKKKKEKLNNKKNIMLNTKKDEKKIQPKPRINLGIVE